jgi:hypothetical protein
MMKKTSSTPRLRRSVRTCSQNFALSPPPGAGPDPPDDGVPYIGRVTPWSRRVYVATGFKKWGMTTGTLAGVLITDAIVGRDNPWAAMFCATRIKPLAEGPRFMSENSRVGVRFVADRILARGGRDIADLAPGEGAIVSSDGQKVAGYRDDTGALQCGLHAVHASGLPCGLERRRDQLGLFRATDPGSTRTGRSSTARPPSVGEATHRAAAVTPPNWPGPRHSQRLEVRVRGHSSIRQ